MEAKINIYKTIDVSLGGSLIAEIDTKALLDVCDEWTVFKDSYLCDCDKKFNFGRLCKYSKRYKKGGCK